MENDAVERAVKSNNKFADEKAVTYYQSSKEKCELDRKGIIEIFQKMEQLEKEIILTIEIKNISDMDRERKEDYYYKRNKLLNYLIHCIKEVENICIIRQIFYQLR